MQIVPFLPHYQLVYTNLDFSSFSLISCIAKPTLLPCKRAAFGMQNNRFYNVLIYRWLCYSCICEKYLHPYRPFSPYKKVCRGNIAGIGKVLLNGES